MFNKFNKISLLIISAVTVFSFPQSSFGAATIEAFDLNPKQISGRATLNYNFRIKADRNTCEGGRIYWSIERMNSIVSPDQKVARQGQWAADTFLINNGVKEERDSFSFSLWPGLTSEPLQLVLGCRVPLRGQTQQKARSELITISSGAPPTGILSVRFGATPNRVAPNTATDFQFTLRLTAKRSDLDCREGAPVVWAVYKFPQTSPDNFSESALVERGAVPVDRFAAATSTTVTTTVEQDFSKNVTTPNANFNFKARVTCDRAFGSDELTKSSAVPISVSGTGGTGTCNNNGTCDSGETSSSCPRDCPVTPGGTETFMFKLDNPLDADNLIELIDVLATWLFNLSIPVVVVMIVYAGVMFLTSRGDTTKVTKARQILLYAVIGFTIILVGKGFITLIESVLNLGTGTGGVQQQQQPGGRQSTFPITGGIACRGGADCPQGFSCDTTSAAQQVVNGQTYGTCFASARGDLGSSCSRDRDCFSGLICNTDGRICQRPGGNFQGEPCAGGGTCAENRGCDASGDSVQVIGGQNRGTCR